ncbi:MAG: BamA/TamA family outer membrane protein [Ginsengibacter sp.]
MKFLSKLFFLLTIIISVFSQSSLSQKKEAEDSASKFKTVVAGPQYKRSKWHQFLWGKNYRKEWSTPVRLPVFLLNERNGALVPTGEGGGHQTTSLHLQTKDGKNYTLRSVDKRLGKVLPDIFRGTFIEHIANDEVSMSNPYSAVTVPGMAQSAGIYHTNPEYVYLPKQAALDSFNDKVGNKMYLFEQRLKGDWKNADNLGNFEKFYDTSDVIKKIQEDAENQIDQAAFAKARLFDMFLGDWDRHGDQWRWGIVKKDGEKNFVPVPQDRDQVYFKHNGVILDAAIYASGIGYFQSFKDHISNVKNMNFEERWQDRLFTNHLSRTGWETAAKELQQSLTDNVIENSVKKLPPEIFAISGNKIIADLKSRRNHLLEYATKYYLFLSKEVNVVGTWGSDYFEVKRLNDSETVVKLYNINKKGIKEDNAYYSRTFFTDETKEIRLYGLSGKDVYTTDGKVNAGITIRIIGGYDKDSILINSAADRKAKTYVYNNPDDYIKASEKIKHHTSTDSATHSYNYRDFTYDKRGSNAALFYSLDDRIFIGLGYGWEHHHWRKSPYVFKQAVSVHYSITQKAVSFTYAGIIPNTIGKWNLAFLGNYDFIRWTNFYGLGNETEFINKKDKDFNRMRTRGATGSIAFNRKAGNNFFEIKGFYQSVKILSDGNRYTIDSIAPKDPTVFNMKSFAGAAVGYGFSKLNDIVVPTSGIAFSGNASYTQNVNQSSQSFWKYGGNLQVYLPLVSKFSLAVSGGIQTVDGNPEFYQYPTIGGGQDLRGFQLQRFYGKTAFYNSNELRYIGKIKNYVFNGKAGLLAFVDDGRVWMPGEKSDTWHIGYGGGIVLAPFNLIFVDITYGFSNEYSLLQFRLNMPL